MAKILKEISTIVGKYNDPATGKEKNRYMRLGSIIETKNGDMLKLDVIPLRENGWDGWAFINDPMPRDKTPKGAPPEEEMAF